MNTITDCKFIGGLRVELSGINIIIVEEKWKLEIVILIVLG